LLFAPLQTGVSFVNPVNVSDSIKLSDIPAILQPFVTSVTAALADSGAWSESVASSKKTVASAARVLASSEYVSDVVQRYPEMLPALVESNDLFEKITRDSLELAFSKVVGPVETDDQFMRRLRLFRHRELSRIVWRDISGWADCATTLEELSALADVCIRVAVNRSKHDLTQRFGQPLDQDGAVADFIVVAMGKLGGQELNFSSDIDLVFLYSAAGKTDGSRSIANEEFFRRLAQHFINLVGKQTVDGFVYRVDTRLRPFGESGPLACSTAAFEDYLQQHGRDWERYAWVKARIVNDWSGSKDFNARILRPFVYRRYLDYGVFSSLREMKMLIEREGRAATNRDNIKLGPGGIREIEFIVQTLQLVRGGSVKALRQRQLLLALQELRAEKLMTDVTVEKLTDTYLYLRALENRIQSIADRQTHNLPDDAVEQARLCLAMGCQDWAELVAVTDSHRQVVIENFDEILRHDRNNTSHNSESDDEAHGAAADHTDLEAVAAEHFENVDEVLQKVAALRSGSMYRQMSDTGTQRLERLLPDLIAACGGVDQPARALDGVLRVIESIGRRSAYISLLNENTAALDRLVSLCGSSDFLARQVAAHPLLLDELLDHRIFSAPPDRKDLEHDLQHRLTGAGMDDTERRFEALRNFQQAAVFRVAVADMSGALPLMQVSDRLTDIAELVLEEAIAISFAELSGKHGMPCCVEEESRRRVGFAIAGYGKLGGYELGYGSDLDIVYMHDSDGQEQITDGDKPIDNVVFFGRLARRITHILTMPTPTGALYEVDTRLRPSGNSGLLVTSLTALAKYQRDDAWTWEHQALLRARAVAGDERVRAAFEALRRKVLVEYVRRDSLYEEVLAMRQRMRSELNKSTTDQFDLKQGEGGVVDIEFQVQYLVLMHAIETEGLIRFSDNIRQLEALKNIGLLADEEAGRLADTYRTYRETMHRLSLKGDARLVGSSDYQELRNHVIAMWNNVFGALP
jgi:glutamate-ammonia-ligase adenylyltransferase